jgi:hypothetical protein
MAEGEETDEHCAEKDTRIDTLTAEMASLKVTHRKELELEKQLSQSGEAVMWAELPNELLGMVLEKLQQIKPAAPLAGGVKGSKHVRLVSRGWRNSHDALVTRLTLSSRTTDHYCGCWCGSPRGGERGDEIRRRIQVDGRGAEGGEQPHWAHVSEPPLLQRDVRGGGGASSRHRFLQPPHHSVVDLPVLWDRDLRCDIITFFYPKQWQAA